MIISISGIERSGSTVQYNVVRLILLEMGFTVNICGNKYINRPLGPGKVDLLKIHTYAPRVARAADYIFLTERNIADIKASMERFYGEKPSHHKISNARAWLMAYKQLDNSYLIPYDRFKDDKMVLIEWAKRILNADVDPQKILRQFNAIGLPDEGQDDNSLFFHNHITKK